MCTFASAQFRGKRKGPRAIAVVRWDADAKDRAIPVLIPVTILDEGKFYDAGVYKAAPAPMPLLVGTVYEAQDKGELLGYFTIKSQLHKQQKENWVALGDWESASPPMDKMTGRPSHVEIVRGPLTEQTGSDPGDNNDDRDLNKKTTTVYDENGKPMPAGTPSSPAAPMGGAGKDQPRVQNNPSSTSDSSKSGGKKGSDDPDRPTLKREGSSTDPAQSAPPAKTAGQTPAQTSSQKPADTNTSSSSSGSSDSTVPATQDPDRPQLKRGKPATQASAGGLPHTVSDDPGRPVIRRNSGNSAATKKEGIPVPPRVLDRGPLLGEGGSDAPVLLKTRTYEAVAVSDATVDPPTDFRYKMTSDERERMQAKMDEIAQDEVGKYLKSIGRATLSAPAAAAKPKTTTNPKNGARRTAKSAQPEIPHKSLFAETQFEVYDLNHRNDAILLFSGRERTESENPAGRDVYVTYVARVDYEGNPHGIFRSVTVNDRLDVMPKLELIDAIDAKGDGVGELLFRRVSDNGAEFAIYSVNFDGLTEIFHGGAAD